MGRASRDWTVKRLTGNPVECNLFRADSDFQISLCGHIRRCDCYLGGAQLVCFMCQTTDVLDGTAVSGDTFWRAVIVLKGRSAVSCVCCNYFSLHLECSQCQHIFLWVLAKAKQPCVRKCAMTKVSDKMGSKIQVH